MIIFQLAHFSGNLLKLYTNIIHEIDIIKWYPIAM